MAALFKCLLLCLVFVSVCQCRRRRSRDEDAEIVDANSKDDETSSFPPRVRLHRQHFRDGARGRHGSRHGFRHGGAWWKMGNLTDEERLARTCERLTNASDVREYHHRGRRFNNETWQMKQEFHARMRQMVAPCCDMEDAKERVECYNRGKLAHYDRVCNGEETLCPFASRAVEMTSEGQPDRLSVSAITTKCCAEQGSDRLKCFMDTKAANRQAVYEQKMSRRQEGGRGHHRRHGRREE